MVVRQTAAVLHLLASEDETLLINWDTFLIIDLCLDIVNRVRGLYIQGDGLARQRLHEDLHASAQAEHQVKGRLLLNVVVAQRATILQLLPGEDQALLVLPISWIPPTKGLCDDAWPSFASPSAAASAAQFHLPPRA